MNEYCMIETASDNKDEIKNIAKQLLDKKLVASCHIIESESIWNWNKEREEAKEFLEDCFAQVFENISEVRAYLDEEGMDVSGVSDEELADELEVFAISDGRYFVVEA